MSPQNLRDNFMNSSDYDKQVNEARRIHSWISEDLKSLPIILSKPKEKISHSLEFRPQTEEELKTQEGFQQWRENRDSFLHISELEYAGAADDYLDFQVPYIKMLPEDRLLELQMLQDWARTPDLKLLKAFLMKGWVPDDSFRDDGKVLPIHQALIGARQLGYKIPDNFLTPRKPREDKENAYYAAMDLKRGQIRFSSEDYVIRKISSLCSSFLVPDPDEDWKTPFVVDQLWIVQERNAQVRFIAVEIDSTFDLTEENKAKAKIRDEKLARQGLEVYHIAGWWCLVDSWRAIAEFLRIADIYPNAVDNYAWNQLNTINDYKCDKCKEPMVRYDDYWIQIMTDEYDDDYIVHEACLDEY